MISQDDLEEAIECLREMDEDLYILIQQQWKALELESIRGAGLQQHEVRTAIASNFTALFPHRCSMCCIT